jgi:hypothetical protein
MSGKRTMRERRFQATLKRPDTPGCWTYVDVPFDVEQIFGHKGRESQRDSQRLPIPRLRDAERRWFTLPGGQQNSSGEDQHHDR